MSDEKKSVEIFVTNENLAMDGFSLGSPPARDIEQNDDEEKEE